MWYRTPVSKTASISGERRPRRPWAPNAPRPTPTAPASAPINRNVRSIPTSHPGLAAQVCAGLHRRFVQRGLHVLLPLRPAESLDLKRRLLLQHVLPVEPRHLLVVARV